MGRRNLDQGLKGAKAISRVLWSDVSSPSSMLVPPGAKVLYAVLEYSVGFFYEIPACVLVQNCTSVLINLTLS